MFEPIIPSLFYLAVHAIDAGACDISLVKDDMALLNHKKLKCLPKNLKDSLRLCSLRPGSGVKLDPDHLGALLHEGVRELHLSECNERHIQSLEVSRGLRKLNLNGAINSPECSTQLDLTLRRFPALKVLYLRKNPLSVCDHHLFTIARYCPFLLELDLGDCEGLTDAGLAGHAGIASLRQLHSLNLSRTNITDSGLEALASGPVHWSLRELRVDRCHKITDDGIEAVLACCDKLTIFIFHGCPRLTARSQVALENFLLDHQIQMKQTTFTIY